MEAYGFSPSLFLQIQACTSDFENEKLDRQNLQHQLNKVLKELHKAREQITHLEPSVSIIKVLNVFLFSHLQV